jgi:release factor glutamine methyltransferase
VTLHQIMAAGRTRLVAAGVAPAEAAIDVDLFVRTILKWDRAQVITAQSERVPSQLEPMLDAWLVRRARHEPAAYIVGTKEFWGLEFCVTPAVLVPRPETELIVEEALRLAADQSGSSGIDRALGLRLADVGTGSGCIAVSLARDLPRGRIVATDVSTEALAVARENAERHGVADRITFVASPYLEGTDGSFDVIAANPPYVSEKARPALGRAVAHEPDVALFGGADGLRDISGVLDAAAERLRPGGWLVMEFGFGQDEEVIALVARQPALTLQRIREDLQGIPRTAVIQHTA